MAALKLFLVEFQCLFLSSLCRIGHVTFPWFLDAIHITGQTSTDEDFSEKASSLRILQTVDCEYLPALHISQSKYSLDVIKTLLELSLIEKNGNVRIVDNSFLDNRTADNILQLLRNDTYHSPEFSGGFIQILDVFCHHR